MLRFRGRAGLRRVQIGEFAALEEGVDDVLDGGQKIKNSKPDLKNWVTKNEDLGVKKYGCFLTDYLDYDLAVKVEHLNVFLRSVEKTDLFIDRQDFKNTIDFLEVFNELYWVQDILSVRIIEFQELTIIW